MTRKNLKSEFVAQGKREFNNKVREQQRSVLQAGIERNKRLGPNAPPNGPQTSIGRTVPYKSAEKSVNGKTWEERERELEEEFNKQQNAREEQERTNEKEYRLKMLERERVQANERRRRASEQLGMKQRAFNIQKAVDELVQSTAVKSAIKQSVQNAVQKIDTTLQNSKAARKKADDIAAETNNLYEQWLKSKNATTFTEYKKKFNEQDAAEEHAVKAEKAAIAAENAAEATIKAAAKAANGDAGLSQEERKLLIPVRDSLQNLKEKQQIQEANPNNPQTRAAVEKAKQDVIKAKEKAQKTASSNSTGTGSGFGDLMLSIGRLLSF
jgi:colicin import membrane protein